MAGWPLCGDGQRFESAGEDTTDSGGTTVTGAVAIHEKGSYAELIASTAFDAAGIFLMVGVAETFTENLVDIAVGSAGLEQIVLENIFHNATLGAHGGNTSVFFPLPIPAGSRLAARQQENSTFARILDVSVILMGQGQLPSSPFSRVDTYGVDTSDTGGTEINPGGTAHTKGLYTEIVASADHDISALVIHTGQQGRGGLGDAKWLVDIAVGAGGSEKIVIPDLRLNSDAADDAIRPGSIGPLPVNIPSGTRIAVRAQCSIISTTNRLFDIILYGIS